MKNAADFTGPRPSPDDVRRMWERLRFQAFSFDHSPIVPFWNDLLKAFSQVEPLLYCFSVPEDPILDWYAIGRNTLGTMDYDLPGMDFFSQFLGSQGVRTAAKELEIPEPLILPVREDRTAFSSGHPLLFEGQMALMLYEGGPFYATGMKYRGMPASQARGLAEKFRAALFGDRYEDVLSYSSSWAWSPWFADVGVDETIILFDRRLRRIWLLCMTDTD